MYTVGPSVLGDLEYGEEKPETLWKGIKINKLVLLSLGGIIMSRLPQCDAGRIGNLVRFLYFKFFNSLSLSLYLCVCVYIYIYIYREIERAL